MEKRNFIIPEFGPLAGLKIHNAVSYHLGVNP